MKRLSMILLTVFFITFIFLAMTVTLFRPKETYSFFENRNYADFPEISFSPVYEGKFFDGLEKFLVDHAALRTTILKINTTADLRLLRRPVINQVVVKDDILLPWLNYSYIDEESTVQDTDNFVKNLSAFAQLVESYGGYYCYVGVPCQYAYFEDEYPWFLENRARLTHTVLPAFKESAERYGVNFLDMGQVMEDLGRPEDFGSRVDNHYGLKGAYLTYQSIIDRINEDTGLELSYPVGDAITFHELPNMYMGSRTRKLMGLVGNSEKLYTASFAEDIPFKRTDNGKASETGVYSLPSPGQRVLYSLYMGGDIAETVIDTGQEELPSALIYGDSFTNAVECLAYYSFNEMRAVDLRHYSEMSLKDYVERYKPDIVICIRDYEAITLWEGNGSLFEKK